MTSGLYRNGNMALIAQNGRWHFCFLKGPEYQTLDTVNFMNETRADEMKKNSFSTAVWMPYEDCSEIVKQDLQKKILPEAENYRSLLEANICNLVVGFTSDTLTAVPNDPDKIEAILGGIAESMKEGQNGLYLRFNN